MTTELAITRNYRLDTLIGRIVEKAEDTAKLIQEYFETAEQFGMSTDEAKKYARRKIPNTTFYRHFSGPLSETKQAAGRLSHKSVTTREHNLPEESYSDTTYKEFDTKGMGVAVEDEDEDEVTQTVNCPTATPSDEEHDRLVSRIQELEKMVSEVSFQKGAEVPTKQIIILPHSMVLEVYRKRMEVGLNGIMKLTTDNNIVTGIEVVNVQ